MKVVKQKVTLPIINFDDCVVGNGVSKHPATNRHSVLLPNSIRAIICGPSNCGKSNLMLSLLLNENGLKFENIYIYSKSLYQPKYMYLERVLKNIVNYFPYKENDEIISPSDAHRNSIFIFDDVACYSQEKIREYFSMGRHNNIDSFYLCQTYTRIPKHLIRDNANLIVLFKQDEMNLKHVYNDHVGSSDMLYEQFKKICDSCWNANKFGFLTINKDCDLNSGRYRCNLDKFIQISEC